MISKQKLAELLNLDYDPVTENFTVSDDALKKLISYGNTTINVTFKGLRK